MPASQWMAQVVKPNAHTVHASSHQALQARLKHDTRPLNAQDFSLAGCSKHQPVLGSKVLLVNPTWAAGRNVDHPHGAQLASVVCA
jgi:hypothetical protein